MSSKGPITSQSEQRDQWRSNALRRINRGDRPDIEAARELLAQIPEQWATRFTGFDLSAKLLRCRMAACLTATGRAEALGLLATLPPVPLTHVKYNYQPYRVAQGIWPVTFKNEDFTVKERIPVAPVLFTVHQGLNFGPLVSAQWVTRINGKPPVAVSVTIEGDPAAFEQEREGVRRAGSPGVFKYRWARNEWFPPGWETGWFGRWGDDPNENAHCTMFWPLHKFPHQHGEDHDAYAGRLFETERIAGLLERMRELRKTMHDDYLKEKEGQSNET